MQAFICVHQVAPLTLVLLNNELTLSAFEVDVDGPLPPPMANTNMCLQ